ncbi:MAG: Gfo/Idh/MocA family oxidoreductase [Planctomycetota bacterium]|nr:Gfo/Idh/MocA family oxidoreductase [Planctomycetota bacterium]
MTTSRRTFIKGAASAIAGAPFILSSTVWGAQTKPNDRAGMGFIGIGKQGGLLLRNFLHRDLQVLAVCDVDTTRRADAKKKVDAFYADNPDKGSQGCKEYNDFRELLARKDIDLVCIATPDHWHAIVTLAALRAGKDVYCEKPLTHNIHEAVEVMKAVDANKRVLQTGSMQRSMKEFRVACELVRNGAIGKVERVECSFGDPAVPCDLPEERMEPGLDWNLWLGPAPKRPYNSVLCPRGVHRNYPNWRSYREFGGGAVTDFGAHHMDIAQWGLDMDSSGPVEVRPPAAAGAKRGAVLVYANGVTLTHKDGFQVHFFGAEGEVQVDRGRFTFSRGAEMIAKFTGPGDKTSCAAEVQKAERGYLKDAKVKLYVSLSQTDDFLARVKDRGKPICNEQVGGHSAIVCHLMNQAYYHGKKMQWDPAKFAFTGGTGDPKWLTRDYRSPWMV